MTKRKPDKLIKKNYKMVSFLLITVAFFTFFAIRPSVSMIVNLAKEKAEYERIDANLESKIQQILTTQYNFMQLLEEKDLINQAIPNSHQIEKTKALLERDLETENFTIGSISIRPTEKVGLNSIDIKFAGAGKYNQVIDFLKYVYNSRRVMTYNDLTLESQNQSSASAAISLSTTISSYYYVNQ